MVQTSNINVEVMKKSKCIFKDTSRIEANDFNSLISNLKSMQQKVNEFLTGLVQVEQTSNQSESILYLYTYIFFVAA